MTFKNRPCKKFAKGMLYAVVNGRRISTNLEDTPNNRKLVTSYHKNDEFLKKFDVKKTSKTLISLCDEVLELKEKTIKPSSYYAYSSLFNSRIKPFFEDIDVVDIIPIDIKNFYLTFEDKSTLNTCKAILKEALELAILSRIIVYNPLSMVSLPKFENKYNSNPFNMEDMQLVVSSAKSSFRNLLGLAFATGMRGGEIIALKWSHIDFINQTISIEDNHVSGRVQTPKTKQSKAVIDLPHEAVSFLKDQQLKTGLREYLFYNEKTNKPYMYETNINRLFQKHLKSINLEVRGFHQIRHTFASLKLSYYERIEWVSFMLRHKSPDFTRKVYYKYLPRKKEKRVIFSMDSVAQIEHTNSVSS